MWLGGTLICWYPTNQPTNFGRPWGRLVGSTPWGRLVIGSWSNWHSCYGDLPSWSVDLNCLAVHGHGKQLTIRLHVLAAKNTHLGSQQMYTNLVTTYRDGWDGDYLWACSPCLILYFFATLARNAHYSASYASLRATNVRKHGRYMQILYILGCKRRNVRCNYRSWHLLRFKIATVFKS